MKITGLLYDTYDYTEFVTAMNDYGLGTAANNAAHISQKTGAINHYDIYVYFEMNMLIPV